MRAVFLPPPAFARVLAYCGLSAAECARRDAHLLRRRVVVREYEGLLARIAATDAFYGHVHLTRGMSACLVAYWTWQLRRGGRGDSSLTAFVARPRRRRSEPPPPA